MSAPMIKNPRRLIPPPPPYAAPLDLQQGGPQQPMQGGIGQILPQAGGPPPGPMLSMTPPQQQAPQLAMQQPVQGGIQNGTGEDPRVTQLIQQATQDNAAMQQQFMQQMQPHDFLDPQTRQTLNTAVGNIAKKLSQGQTPAEKGMRIGQWMGANLLAPAMGAFGKPGTAIGAVQAMQQLQQQNAQSKAEEDNAQREHLNAIQAYGNLLNKADKSDMYGLGLGIKEFHESRKNLIDLLRGGAYQQNQLAGAGAKDEQAGLTHAKAQTETNSSPFKVEYARNHATTELARGGAQTALGGKYTSQNKTEDALRQPKVDATNALGTMRTQQGKAAGARADQTTQLTPGKVSEQGEKVNTAKERTNKLKADTENKIAETAVKKGGAAKKGIKADYSPNPQVTTPNAATGQPGLPSPEAAGHHLGMYRDRAKNDPHHPEYKKFQEQMQAMQEMYPPEDFAKIKKIAGIQ